jgi:hypothetical protein
VQECLTNVHRHSGSPSAAIRITHEDHRLRVEIEDDGKRFVMHNQRAFDANSQSGVGIRGMRERRPNRNKIPWGIPTSRQPQFAFHIHDYADPPSSNFPCQHFGKVLHHNAVITL